MSTPIIFFASADNHSLDYLPALHKEENEIGKALFKAKDLGACQYYSILNASIKEIADTFLGFKDRIKIFHYAGHTHNGNLLLAPTSSEEIGMSRKRLGEFFKMQKGLELVFLNGCATIQQVEELLKENSQIKAVIGTTRDIEDQKAMNFAVQFYKGLGEGLDIQASFDQAQLLIDIGEDVSPVHFLESAKHRTINWEGASSTDEFPWRLYRLRPNPPLNWRLELAGKLTPEKESSPESPTINEKSILMCNRVQQEIKFKRNVKKVSNFIMYGFLHDCPDLLAERLADSLKRMNEEMIPNIHSMQIEPVIYDGVVGQNTHIDFLQLVAEKLQNRILMPTVHPFELSSLEELVEAVEIEKIRNKFLIIPFSLGIDTAWSKDTFTFIQWCINTFILRLNQAFYSYNAKFVLFTYITLPGNSNLMDLVGFGRKSRLLKKINQSITDSPNCIVLDQLHPISQKEVNDWTKSSQIPSQIYQPLLNIFKKDTERYHMMHIKLAFEKELNLFMKQR